MRARPGQLHVADFTYVPLDGGGFGYTAFVIDAFAGLIAGWECSLSKETSPAAGAFQRERGQCRGHLPSRVQVPVFPVHGSGLRAWAGCLLIIDAEGHGVAAVFVWRNLGIVILAGQTCVARDGERGEEPAEKSA